jgi:hypothetical protein
MSNYFSVGVDARIGIKYIINNYFCKEWDLTNLVQVINVGINASIVGKDLKNYLLKRREWEKL